MSGGLFVDWAVMAVSLFNTILLLWLGLTVLLNAERRTWGIWLVGGSLLLGSAFFLSHSAILGFGLDYLSQGVNFWWRLGWVPVVLAPFAWYVVMLWYTGYWEGQGSPIRQRHRFGFVGLVLMTVGMAAMLIFANPLPSFTQVIQLNLSAAPSVLGIPVLIVFYPVYILACIGLSLDVLLHPGPTLRVMGDLARRRARPWLIISTLMLLAVSLLVGVVMLWVVFKARQFTFDFSMGRTVAWFDLVIASLIAASILLTGQAVVSYEVFTGSVLPRRGLQRYWRRAIILAAGYGAVVSFSLILSLPAIYSLLLSTCLMVAFYALLGWRSYAERERSLASLQPFVAGPQIYERLMDPASELADLDASTPFFALCDDVLGARLAYLVPLGSLSPLFGRPLAYPNHISPPAGLRIPEPFETPVTLYYPVDAGEYFGASWAVALRNERGLAGMLLLGEKRDGGLYTQEEIEFARTAAERLMDIQVSAQIARRLIVLQRQRLTESQLLDWRSRRVLHDTILPQLHTAMLDLSDLEASEPGEKADVLTLLGDVHHQIADLLHQMPAAKAPTVAQRGLVEALGQVVDEEFQQAFDDVEWYVSPEARQNVESFPVMISEVLFYAAREAVRNAAFHARHEESGTRLQLNVAIRWHDGLEILVEDNGVGIDKTSAGDEQDGQGLALHSTMLAVVGGSMAVESMPGISTRVKLFLPQESVAAVSA